LSSHPLPLHHVVGIVTQHFTNSKDAAVSRRACLPGSMNPPPPAAFLDSSTRPRRQLRNQLGPVRDRSRNQPGRDSIAMAPVSNVTIQPLFNSLNSLAAQMLRKTTVNVADDRAFFKACRFPKLGHVSIALGLVQPFNSRTRSRYRLNLRSANAVRIYVFPERTGGLLRQHPGSAPNFNWDLVISANSCGVMIETGGLPIEAAISAMSIVPRPRSRTGRSQLRHWLRLPVMRQVFGCSPNSWKCPPWGNTLDGIETDIKEIREARTPPRV